MLSVKKPWTKIPLQVYSYLKQTCQPSINILTRLKMKSIPLFYLNWIKLLNSYKILMLFLLVVRLCQLFSLFKLLGANDNIWNLIASLKVFTYWLRIGKEMEIKIPSFELVLSKILSNNKLFKQGSLNILSLGRTFGYFIVHIGHCLWIVIALQLTRNTSLEYSAMLMHWKSTSLTVQVINL
jgi:hypothetical protein